MSGKTESMKAIDQLRVVLWDALQWLPPTEMENGYKLAHDGVTGVLAIDNLLPYVDADDARDIIGARWLFLGRVLDAMCEPAGAASGRGRKDEAKAAGDSLCEAAQSLRRLGSDGLASALEQLAGLVAARAHLSVINVERLSSDEIVPGTRLLAGHAPRQLSAHYSGKRGKGSYRAELIRFICQPLKESVSPTLVASLVAHISGKKCTHADVQQALGIQAKSIRKSRADSSNSALNKAFKDWGGV